jgi:hypothetical protein
MPVPDECGSGAVTSVSLREGVVVTRRFNRNDRNTV